MYSFLLKNLILPVGELFFGGGYLITVKQWNHFDTLSEEELENIQKSRLEQTLKTAIRDVPFYKNLEYDNLKSPLENLKSFPILTKEILRKFSPDLISEKFEIQHLRKNFSSGSSGVQSFSYSEKKNVFYLQGLNYHWYSWGGFEIGKKLLQFGISPKRTLPKKLKDIFFRVQYEEAFTLGKKDYQRITNDLKRKNIQYILGYPSAINQLAEYLIENNQKHKLISIISLGDKLFDHFEENFKSAFKNPKIIDTYGCAEGIMIACRNDLPYYYISSPHVYIEIVDDDGKEVPDGVLGHVLATCFTNDAQPFIRYKLGDLAIKLPKENYPENRKFNYPLLQKIVGRETDVVKTPHGKTLIVHSFTGIFEYFPEIKQFQIVQTHPEILEIHYLTDELIPLKEDTLKKLESKLQNLTEDSMTLRFKNVKSIASAPSGKPQIIRVEI